MSLCRFKTTLEPLVGSTVILAAAKGIVMSQDHTLLAENGGHIRSSYQVMESFFNDKNGPGEEKSVN